jgi:fumarylacetoacetate (FAA) hydrolase
VKLGTLRTGTRDGALLVCSRDLSRAIRADAIAPTLQAALDDWANVEARLQALSAAVNDGKAQGAFALDPSALMAPLPRPFGWIDSSVYLNHMELARKLRNVEMPEVFRHEPLLSPRVPERFHGPREPIGLPAGDIGLDMEGEVAVILGDTPIGTSHGDAAQTIRLITLVNDTSYRSIYARDLARGKTGFHGKGAPVMAPVAVTPDELGTAWDGGKVCLPLTCLVNGKRLGTPDAGVDMHFAFPAIISHAASLRPLLAGTVIGSGTVSNRDRSVGSACIAEARMIETLESGKALTPYLQAGDEVRIEMLDAAGRSVFGAIVQRVQAA